MTNGTRSSSSLPLSSSFFLSRRHRRPQCRRCRHRSCSCCSLRACTTRPHCPEQETPRAALAAAAHEPARPVRSAPHLRCPCRPREGPPESEGKGRRRARQREGMEQRRGSNTPEGGCRSGGGHRSGVPASARGSRRMGARVVGPTKMGLVGGFGWPHKFRGRSRDPARVEFLSKPPYLTMGVQVRALLELL
jgi:hypothetical protein